MLSAVSDCGSERVPRDEKFSVAASLPRRAGLCCADLELERIDQREDSGTSRRVCTKSAATSGDIVIRTRLILRRMSSSVCLPVTSSRSSVDGGWDCVQHRTSQGKHRGGCERHAQNARTKSYNHLCLH